MRFKQTLGLALIAAAVVFGARASKPKPTLESIGNKVYCLCGCVTTLNHCPHPRSECGTRAEMEDLIQKDIAAGKDEEAILADLTARYGVQVLAAPPARGFDLTVWILPGIGLLIGLAIVIVLVRRWRRPPAETAAPAPAPVDPKVLEALEEEMRKAGISR